MKARNFTLLPISIVGVEAVVADSAQAFGRHTHDQFGIGFIERGAQRSASGRGVVEGFAGDLITVNPGEVHDGRPLDTAGRRWRMLYLDPERLQEVARDVMPGRSFEFTSPVIRDAQVATRFHELFASVTSANRLRYEEALLALAARLLGPSLSETTAAIGAGVRAARERIDDAPAEPQALASLAATAGLSRYQFLRAFTRLTGLPPHAYLLQRRVHNARQLVRAGQSLAEAAAASGFADQSHMTRCFVRTWGLTPGAFVSR